MTSSHKTIALIAAGGTIASATVGTGVAPGLSSTDLLNNVPELAAQTNVVASDLPVALSFAVPLGDLELLSQAIQTALAEADGVVVTHGTDTMEESVYAAALTIQPGRPVVFTGAMRNPTLPGADGPANLLAACAVARSEAAAEMGPLVVMNDEIHAARFVVKEHTTRPSAFSSAGAGPVGDIVEGVARIWFRPAYDDFLASDISFTSQNVELVPVAAGMSDALLRAALRQDPAGIVVSGTGAGHLPPSLLQAVDDIARSGIPLVVASRCIAGRNLRHTYDLPGSEIDLIRRGALLAGQISAGKARLRLVAGLSKGIEPSQLFPVE